MPAKKHVLITGVNGLIGSVLQTALADIFEVIGLDKAGVTKRKTFIVNLSDYNETRNQFKKIGPIDYIVHLAGNASAETPWEIIFKDNFQTARNIYECAREFRVKRVILAGSTHMFGGYKGYPNSSPLGRKISLNDPPLSDSDYGDSKIYAETLARRYYDQHKI